MKTAVKEYNTAAANYDSNIKEIDAKEVLEYVYIGQFDILRSSRRQVTTKPWARPAEREALVSFYKLQRAHEEISRLNVEIMRLKTYMRDYTLDAERILSTLEKENQLLGHQVSKRHRLQSSFNTTHHHRLAMLEMDEQFSGSCNPGLALHLSRAPLRTGESDPLSVELGNHGFDSSDMYISDSDSNTDEELAALASEALDIRHSS